jgi:predicted membrane protein DUF2207
MPNASDAPAVVYQFAWIGVAVLCVCYIAITIAFHWSSERKIGVTRYEPPEGISAGVAAYLVESGRRERAFAAGIISLATKGYIEIQQQRDWVALERLRESDASLPLDESVILTSLFVPADNHTYKFNARDCDRMCEAYKKFSRTIEGIADPNLISAHTFVWYCGVAISGVIIAIVVFSLPIFDIASPWPAIAFMSLWIFIGGTSLFAALRIWPTTIRKLGSYLPGNRRRRPLDLNDAIPVILLAPIFLGFSFLAYLTSLKFVLLAVALVIANFIFRRSLEAPTDEGRKAIEELKNFREFLSRADADRLNRENDPGRTPEVLEKYSAYAIALDVEHAWGAEFTGNLLELLQFDRAYDVPLPNPPVPGSDDEIIQLNIDPRK